MKYVSLSVINSITSPSIGWLVSGSFLRTPQTCNILYQKNADWELLGKKV